jgi:hypothetical protein
MGEQEKKCADMCAEESLWGSEFCWDHLVERGEKAVNDWRKKVLENKKKLAGAHIFPPDLSQGAYKIIGVDLSQGAYKSIGLDADFRYANLQGAKLYFAKLQGANLDSANLREATLCHANFQEASLFMAQLQGADLYCAKFQKAYCVAAYLQGAKLKSANFQGANFAGADFKEAKFDSANLQGASLYNARLQGTDLHNANFRDADLSRIKYTTSVRLPDALKNLLIKLLGWRKFDDHLYDLAAIFNLIFIPIAYCCILAVVPCQWMKIFLPFLPVVVPLILLNSLYQNLLTDSEKAEILKDLPPSRKQRFMERLIAPTLWRGAMVESIGSCDPLVLKYIKDQSWLEAKLEESKKSWWSRLWMFLWGISSGYGSNIWLWMFWSLFIALSYGATYWLAGDNLVKIVVNLPGDPGWFKYFYFSIVTFTTLGFGDVLPVSGLGEFIVATEVIAGYMMLGGLISIFTNKLARLS